MIADFFVIPNFFKDPKSIYNLAIKQQYHTYKDEPYFVENNIIFPGRRTFPLTQELKSITDEFIIGTLVNVRKDLSVTISCDAFPTFHSIFDDDDFIGETGLHKDSSVWAAVVYLNEDIPKNATLCGTTIYRNTERIEIPYVYNTMVFYRSDYLHGASGGFGNTIETSRLSINFFIHNINIDVRISNTLKG
jgi:hypothetical protein